LDKFSFGSCRFKDRQHCLHKFGASAISSNESNSFSQKYSPTSKLTARFFSDIALRLWVTKRDVLGKKMEE
jgi:hypothetical protein